MNTITCVYKVKAHSRVT